jgi:hypothetical protein
LKHGDERTLVPKDTIAFLMRDFVPNRGARMFFEKKLHEQGALETFESDGLDNPWLFNPNITPPDDIKHATLKELKRIIEHRTKTDAECGLDILHDVQTMLNSGGRCS